jgi:hypothetical protein
VLTNTYPVKLTDDARATVGWRLTVTRRTLKRLDPA